MKNECIKYVPEVKERLIYYVIAYTASGALLYLFYKNIGVSVAKNVYAGHIISSSFLRPIASYIDHNAAVPELVTKPYSLL